MEHVIYKIGEVSARLGLVDKNSNTLRGWTEEFGEFLSALANPAPGQPRRFTARDLQVLTAVREYRAMHLTYEEIRERLRAGEHDVTAPQSEELPSQANDSPFAENGHALMPVAQLERLLAPLAASADEWRRLAEEYRGRLEAREERIEALEQRIDELYARLDDAAPLPSAETHVEAPTEAHVEAPVAPTPTDLNGMSPMESAISHDAPLPNTPSSDRTEAEKAPLFPLPAVERAPRAEPYAAPATDEPRRPWWRVWR